MLDNLKFRVNDLQIIKRLFDMLEQDFVYYKPDDKHYRSFFHSFKHKDFGVKFRLHFRKVFEKNTSGKKVQVGYRSVDIVISPHYHFNNYRHNGNDFTPENCIKTIPHILTYLGIEPQKYDLLKVVNIEFGLNIVPKTDIKNLINGILYSTRTTFKIPKLEIYFKITDATTYKQIKAYAKGLHCHEVLNAPEIDVNTFRFEVKSKKSANIKKYGIDTVIDLLKPETYQRLGQEIVNEWEQILIINQTPDLSHLKTDEVVFIKKANEPSFWTDLIRDKHRNTFGENKGKYYEILKRKNNLHTQIKGQIIDKLILLSKCAYFPSETPINIEKPFLEESPLTLIKGQSAHLLIENRICLVTKLDISMQKKGSKYLCSAGLKYYKENAPNTYKEIELKYLTPKMRNRSMEDQIYYIAHNIRNTKTNTHHNFRNNRKSFEQRNYNTNQLQFNF